MAKVTVHITKNERYALDHEFRPMVRFPLPGKTVTDERLVGKLDAYCDEYGVKHSFTEQTDRYVFEVRDPDSIERFLEPMMNYLVRRYEESELMIVEILPAIRDGQHREKEGFIKLLRVSAPLRDEPKAGEGHTAEKFEEMWDVEISA